MTRNPSKGVTKTAKLRNVPFFLSGRFFALFAVVSGLLVGTYLAFPDASLQIPLAVDGALILAALLDFSTTASSKCIYIERPLPYPLVVDRPNDIVLEITNRSGRAVSLIIRDDYPHRCHVETPRVTCSVEPGHSMRAVYKLTPLERGNGDFGDIHFWMLSRMGLVWKHGVVSAETTVKLYPGLALIERWRMKMHRSPIQDMVRPFWKKGEGSEFDSLRDYVFGDDARLIHWSTSARKHKLIVRQNRVERSQTIFLVIDAGRMMTARVYGRRKLDYALNAALLLAYGALDLGDYVGVMVLAQDIMCFLPPSKIPGHFGRILDATYALDPRMEEPRFYLALSDLSRKLKRRSLVVIFTDLIDERASEGLTRYCLGLLPRHLPLVVAMADTEVIKVADRAISDKQDLYRQGVASEMLERRARVLARLGSAGVLVLDTPPEKISSAVIDRYLDIKTRNLL